MENPEQQSAPTDDPGNGSTNGIANGAKSDKPRPTRYLPSDRIAFPRQLEVLRAYGALSGAGGQPVTNRQVAEMVKMSESTVSLLNPFFTDSALLRRSDRGFVPASEVVGFNRAFDWNPQKAATKLRPVLEHSWFGEALAPRVSFKPIPEEDALDALADAIAATSDFKPQLRIVLDYLDAGGVVERDGTMIRKVRGEPSSAPADGSQPEPKAEAPTREAREAQAVHTTFSQPTDGIVQFHVSVKVDMAEFSGWQPERITAFFGGIAQVLAAKGAIEKEVSSE